MLHQDQLKSHTVYYPSLSWIHELALKFILPEYCRCLNLFSMNEKDKQGNMVYRVAHGPTPTWKELCQDKRTEHRGSSITVTEWCWLIFQSEDQRQNRARCKTCFTSFVIWSVCCTNQHLHSQGYFNFAYSKVKSRPGQWHKKRVKGITEKERKKKKSSCPVKQE